MRFLTLIFAYLTTALNFSISTWIIQNSGCGTKMNSSTFPYQYYSDIVIETGVIVMENGTTRCDTSDAFLAEYVTSTRPRGIKLIWRDGMGASNLHNVIFNSPWATYRANYLNSINATMIACGLLDDNLSGIIIDEEPTDFANTGYVTVEEANTYSQFVVDLRAAIGPRRTLSVVMGVFGVTLGSYPGMVRLWVNSSVINSPVIDYLDLMSYHWITAGTILPWIKDVGLFLSNWDVDPSKIHLGIPYYNNNGTIITGIHNQPLNCNLLEECPNISPSSYTCDNINIVSKQQNYMIGQLARNAGLKGLFLWAANYDTLLYNNTMARWAYAGLTGTPI